MESLQYLRIQSTESLSVNQIEIALHSLMSDFLTNEKESQVLMKTPKLHYLALKDQNSHVLYLPGFNCPAFERIKLVKSKALCANGIGSAVEGDLYGFG